MNIEKYRMQRRITGLAYTADFMKDLESNLDFILERNIEIMRDRTGQSVDIDIFFNYFASGQSFCRLASYLSIKFG
jgi:hypothetical protein